MTRFLSAGFLTVIGAVMVGGVLLALRYRPELAKLENSEPIPPGFYLGLLPFAVSGWFLAWRKPRNAVGWWLMATAFIWTAASAGVTYGAVGLATVDGPLPGDEFAYVLANPLWAPGLVAIGLVVFLFPTGKPVTPRWSWLFWLAGAVTTLLYGAVLLLPDLLKDVGLANPIGWEDDGGLLGVLELIGTVGLGVLGVATLASLIVRYRRGQAIERQQLKWLLYAVAVLAFVAILGSLRDQLGWQGFNQAIGILQGLGLVAVAFIPVSIAIAVMKYGLYDLGRIVNRTIVYVVVVLLLGLVYAIGVIVASQMVPQGNNELVVAASTLAVAALFNPLRRRVQVIVNRRFYRHSYDPEAVRQHLVEQLRSKVHVEEVGDEFESLVADTFQPAFTSVWVRSDSHHGST
ncbi:MAG: hypothetical protein WBM90_09850 [Acidimicrobiia bacterium]